MRFQTIKNKTMYFSIALWFKILYSQYQKNIKKLEITKALLLENYIFA